jgi:hypothetical protein
MCNGAGHLHFLTVIFSGVLTVVEPVPVNEKKAEHGHLGCRAPGTPTFEVLSTPMIDDDCGDETEEYDVDDYLQGSIPTASAYESSSDQPVVNTDNLCDVCWVEARAKIVSVPCGHSRFCQSCADRCFGSDRKCAVCRTRIELIMPIFLLKFIHCELHYVRFYLIDFMLCISANI